MVALSLETTELDSVPISSDEKSLVYLLRNERGLTYVGCTVNLERRLRQHNEEISGGSYATRGKGPWHVVCKIDGFRSRNEALKFEFAWRRVGRRHVRKYDTDGRAKSLELLQKMTRWSSTSPLASEVPLSVVWT